MNTLKKYKHLLIVAIFTLFISCSQEEVMMFNQKAGVYFNNNATIDFSFFDYRNQNIKEFIIDIPVSISGDSVNYDRKVKMTIVPKNGEKFTTAKPEHYEILDGIIPAGEFVGKIPLKINLVEEMDTGVFVGYYKILPNEDFPYGDFLNGTATVSFTNKLIKPSNWGSLTFYFGNPFSKRWYSFILDVLDINYIPYPSGKGTDKAWSYNELLSKVGKVKSALWEYNKENPKNRLKYEDGDFAEEYVQMP